MLTKKPPLSPFWNKGVDTQSLTQNIRLIRTLHFHIVPDEERMLATTVNID